jgi:hypothetical protein
MREWIEASHQGCRNNCSEPYLPFESIPERVPQVLVIDRGKIPSATKSYVFEQPFYCVIKWVLQANSLLPELVRHPVQANNPWRFNVSMKIANTVFFAASLLCLTERETFVGRK